ncbi:hypothetical protein ANN_24288 [Periplaneta americana]|uniref:Uncharacterized protein n=1 Tax=Periplaneta americana TaxID=6978 RepID=A0ABQ8S340_PERAM|nr:hypothetical protein ANN_24288 [Periplaneta americana]
MAGLYEGGNEPPGSLKATREGPRPTSQLLTSRPHAEAEVDDHPTRMEGNTEGGEFDQVLWVEFCVAQWSERLYVLYREDLRTTVVGIAKTRLKLLHTSWDPVRTAKVCETLDTTKYDQL